MNQYYKGDGKLVLVFGPINRYCNGFSLYYQGHYYVNHSNGDDPKGYSMVVTSTQAHLP